MYFFSSFDLRGDMTFSSSAARPARNPLIAICLICLSVLLVSLASATGVQAATQQKRPGHVYLLRGLLNVFSLGMDQLAYKLQAAGVDATVHSYPGWRGLSDEMIAKYRSGNREPIILMGHSNGADTTILIARRLQQANVPVALIVNFDPVSPEPVPANVRQVVNYYVPAGWGQAVRGDQRFRGQVANINESANYNHFDVDKSDELHRKTIARVLQVVGGRTPRAPVKRKPAEATAAPAAQAQAPSAAAAPAN